MADLFSNVSAADIALLIEQSPLATICTYQDGFLASQMPVVLEQVEGVPTSLLGHFPKHAPQYEVLRSTPKALFLFHGPQAYISPSDAGKSDWAPTWNFATVQIEARLSFDEALTDLSLQAIVETMEQQRGSDWRIEALGPRYEILRRQVIGFRAEITGLRARFKLGQDESDAVFDHILSHSTNPDLAQWMRRMRDR